MTGKLLLRGMLAGLLAGILAFAFASVFGEPQVDAAIAFEEGAAHSHSHGDAVEAGEPEEELVSRQVQGTLGLFTGVVIYSVSMGGIFALVFAYAMGRIGHRRIGPRGLAAILAVLAFVSVILIPGLKYPANPPAVGDPDTIAQRTKLFFLMLVVSIAAMVAAINLGRKLLGSLGGWNAVLAAIVLYLVVMAVAGALFPVVNEVPEHFSADLLWRFRTASLGIHVVMWAVLGVSFGWLAERQLRAVRVAY